MRLGSVPLLLAFLSALPAAQTSFRVSLDGSTRSETARGRLVVFVIRDGSRVADREPIDGPFWDDPQPLFGLDAELVPGGSVGVDDRADAFPLEPSQLAPGKYRAQARFDLARANSEWRREPGNLWSEPAAFEVEAGKAREVALALTHVVQAEALPTVEGVEWFELRSELLSKFRGQDVFLHAGVVLPRAYDPKRKYPAQYEVPGFGGDHRGAAGGRRRRNPEQGPAAELARASFRIVLDPEGPNGHSLFADSANNGPCGEALVTELVPALEKKYPLIAAPSARILRGHSSGGWSTLWLALTYPETFGASWSTAPDPVDFRCFQLVDIYGGKSFYVDASGADMASLRSNGATKMTIRQESRGEDILGPDNTSGQQWDSWFAVFGPKNERSNPAALFHPESGALDVKVAAAYKKYDLGELLRTQPARYLPLFHTNIHLICGTEDSFYLNEAVQLLADELAKHPRDAADSGYVKLVPGDHGSVFGHESMQAIPGEVLTHFRGAGHAPAGN